MALVDIVDVLYIIDILNYAIIDNSWGIGVLNVEFAKLHLLLPLLFYPFPNPLMLCLVFCFNFFDDLLKLGFTSDAVE